MPDVTDFGVTGDGKVQGRAAGNLALPPYRVRSARFQRPLTLSLSPSDGERVVPQSRDRVRGIRVRHISLVVVSSGARYKSGNDFVAVNLAARR